MNKPNAIYVHIPFCKARCGYCAFCSCTDFSLVDAYFNRLFDEIDNCTVVDGTVIDTLFIGGGTPSSVGEVRLVTLIDRLRAKFPFAPNAEITVECNPESTNSTLLSSLAQVGVNRISFGLQSVNDSTLRRIGRLHNYADFLQALACAHSCGITNVNADLILGLPESFADFRHSADTVASLPLTHVSVYALELHQGTPFADYCARHFPHDDDTLADMYDYALSSLHKAGFARYEVSNFAKDGYPCRHNLNYWQEGEYYAFGASASGFVNGTRFTNVSSVTEYIDSPNPVDFSEVVTPVNQANEFVMLGLRLSSGISLDGFSRRFGTDFHTLFPAAAKLMAQGFLVESGGNVFVPAHKFYVLNSILAELLNFQD